MSVLVAIRDDNNERTSVYGEIGKVTNLEVEVDINNSFTNIDSIPMRIKKELANKLSNILVNYMSIEEYGDYKGLHVKGFVDIIEKTHNCFDKDIN